MEHKMVTCHSKKSARKEKIGKEQLAGVGSIVTANVCFRVSKISNAWQDHTIRYANRAAAEGKRE
jgi:hypothetical protein